MSMLDPRELDFWSVDPGDIHVGLAQFRGGVCVSATETRPDEFCDMLYDLTQAAGPTGVCGETAPDLVVLERFALRGALMAQQQGSEFLTSQMIGAIRFICRRGIGGSGVPLVMQTPQQASVIKKREPWASWPQRRWVSYGHGGHAKVAEQHGYFFIQERLREQDRAQMNLWMHEMGKSPSAG